MNEERERIRCQNCELVQWSERPNCRRCGVALPQPIVKVVERVIEKIIIRQDPQCLASLEQARELIAAASQRLVEQTVEQAEPVMSAEVSKLSTFPTMAEMERAMIVSAYNRSNRKSVEAAKLLGMGKTTFYRKLKELGKRAA